MKTILSACLVILSFSLVVSAQKPVVKWGDVISDEKQTNFKILGEDENSIYILRFQHDHRNISIPFFVQMDRNTLQVKKSTEMHFNVPDNGDLHFNDIYYLKDKFVALLSLTNRKNKMDAALGYVIDKNGEINSNNKMLLETPEGNANIGDVKFRFLITPDSTRFAAVASKANKEHDFAVAVFDADLNGLWSTTFSMRTDKKESNIDETAVGIDNNANFYLMGKATSKAAIVNEPMSKMYVYNYKEKKLKTFDVQSLDKNEIIHLNTGEFSGDKDGHIAFVGLYGESRSEAEGVVYVNCTPEKITTSFKPFSSKLLSAFMSDSKAEKGKGVDHLRIDRVILNDDRSFEIVFYNYSQQAAYEAASVIKYNEGLKEVWTAPVAMRYYASTNYMSFATMIGHDELCFLYNDHKSNVNNLDPRSSKLLVDLNSAVSVLTRVNLKSGAVKKEQLFSAGELETYLMPAKCIQSSPTEMLLFAKKRADIRFGKLKIE